jgi:hypothetical protein
MFGIYGIGSVKAGCVDSQRDSGPRIGSESNAKSNAKSTTESPGLTGTNVAEAQEPFLKRESQIVQDACLVRVSFRSKVVGMLKGENTVLDVLDVAKALKPFLKCDSQIVQTGCLPWMSIWGDVHSTLRHKNCLRDVSGPSKLKTSA